MGKAVQGGSVNFYDFAGYPRATASRESRGAQRVGKVAWDSIDELILECFPSPPQAPGQFPGIPWLFCDTMSIETLSPEPGPDEMDVSGDVPTYDWGKVEINYSTLDYDSQSDPNELLTENYDFGAEMMEIASSGMRWFSQSSTQRLPTAIPLFKKIPIMNVETTWHRVYSIPIVAIRNLIGCINVNTFRGCVAESLLFSGARITYTFDTQGQQTWTVTYQFQQKLVWQAGVAYGWNHQFRPETGLFERIVTPAGNNLYYHGNFQTLLTPG